MNETILDNPRAGRIRRVAELHGSKGRRRSGRMLVEAPQAVREAVTYRPESVLDLYVQMDGDHPANDRARDIIDAATASGERIYIHRVTQRVMAAISGDAQGLAAVVSAEGLVHGLDGLEGSVPSLADPEAPMTVAAFWQVRDPGNAGTVIRTADAAGIDAVVFVDECVDPLSPKVVRATAGSLFHIPVARAGSDEFVDWCSDRRIDLVAADVYGTPGHGPVPLPDWLSRSEDDGRGRGRRRAILFGNEARGLPTGLLERCDGIVSIPIYGRAESLNLATSAAVLLYATAMRDRS